MIRRLRLAVLLTAAVGGATLGVGDLVAGGPSYGAAGVTTMPDAPCEPMPLVEREAHQLGRSIEVGSGPRAVAIGPEAISLYESGELIRRRVRPEEGAYTLDELVTLVGDADWIAETEPGVFATAAALIQKPGSSLVIADVELRLIDEPGVVLYGEGSELVVDGARLTSWDPAARDFDHEIGDGRPYIAYARGSTIHIDNAEVIGLGWNALQSYGLTISDYETNAHIADSYFAHNYFGLYTREARGLVIEGNLFELNHVYGIDPHTGSRDLVIRDNVARCHGRHGIIISEDVTDSLITGNDSHDNRLNGIVVDERSDRATVTDNRVWGNGGDGIVIAGSQAAVVSNNESFGNRIGIRLSLPGTDGTVVLENEVQNNTTGFEAGEATGAAQLDSNRWLDNSVAGLVVNNVVTASNETVSGSDRALDVRGTVTLADSAITASGTGLVVRPRGVASVNSSRILVDDVGIDARDGASVEVVSSTIRADRPLRGAAGVTASDLQWFRLGAIARRLLVTFGAIALVTLGLVWLHSRSSSGLAASDSGPVDWTISVPPEDTTPLMLVRSQRARSILANDSDQLSELENLFDEADRRFDSEQAALGSRRP